MNCMEHTAVEGVVLGYSFGGPVAICYYILHVLVYYFISLLKQTIKSMKILAGGAVAARGGGGANPSYYKVVKMYPPPKW